MLMLVAPIGNLEPPKPLHPLACVATCDRAAGHLRVQEVLLDSRRCQQECDNYLVSGGCQNKACCLI